MKALWILPGLALLAVSYLILPAVFFMNALFWIVSSTVITIFGARFFEKITPQHSRLKIAYFSFLTLFVVSASIAILFGEYPFWINVPEKFCVNERVKARICALESDVAKVDEQLMPIYVVGHGWHTGLMLRVEDFSQDFPNGFWQKDLDLSHTKAVEIGWGDEGFYRATDYTMSLTLKALLLPTPSVMHVVMLPKPAAENFPYSDIYIYWARASEYKNLLTFIDATFSKDEQGSAIELGKGIYGNSLFFRANGSFHFPKSCNGWVTDALAHAGAPVWPKVALTARNTLHQIGMVGDVVRQNPGLKLLPN